MCTGASGPISGRCGRNGKPARICIIMRPSPSRNWPASCTAFILPSLEEGFARSLLEAMAVGLPIIATHESGATTLLDGRSARIIPAADAEAIYRAMKELCDNPALVHRLGEQAYAAFGGSENTWEAYAGRLAEAYRERLERLRESAGQRGSR